LRFGLKDIAELPSIEEFEKMAGELIEQEEMQMPEPKKASESEETIVRENLREEADATEPQADGDSEELTPDAASIDGRISGLDPNYSELNDDPSADEAAIQRGEGVE
jgi:segregation and condensation protein B